MNIFSSLVSPQMRDNPYPLYAMARQMTPLLYNDAFGGWVVFRYEDARAVLLNPAAFSSDAVRYVPNFPKERQTILSMDPPRHRQLRGLVDKAFTPRRVADLEPRIAQITNEVLDTALTGGRIDIIDDLAYPLPVIIIAELLGIPPTDRAAFKRWSDVIVARLGEIDLGGAIDEEFDAAQEEMAEYLTDQIERHRQQSRDDLIGALLLAEVGGQKLTADEVLSFVVLLLVAGNETTTNLIGNSVRCFLEHLAELERVRADLSLVPSAVEEVLRYRPPVQATRRFVTQETQIGGQTFKEGQRVMISLASANRDAAEFPDPERFDVSRQPNRHLTFGLGIHFCLGAPLARLEAKVAIETLLRRVPAFCRADDTPYEPVEGFVLHGVKRLPLLVDSTRAAATM